MGKFSLIGVYRIRPTEMSISVAAKYHHYDWLLDKHGRFKGTINWNNLGNLALLEFQVFGDYTPSELGEITQADQAPYLEAYLDPSGTRGLSEAEAIQTDRRRVFFFLHFVDASIPIRVCNRLVDIEAIGELPDRLVPYAHYVPPD